MTSKPEVDLPFQYLSTAIDFYNSAYSEFHRRGIDNLTVYSLIFHSFEVILKGFLLRSGKSTRDTRKFNHNLCKLLDESNASGLNRYSKSALTCSCKGQNNQASLGTICHLSAHQYEKQLYYPKNIQTSGEGQKSYPDTEEALKVCKELLLDLLNYVGGEYKIWAEKQFKEINSSFTKEYFNAENGLYQIEPYDQNKKKKLVAKYNSKNA